MTDQSTQDLSKQREEGIRTRLASATPGPWELGHVWLTAGLIYSDSGDRVGTDQATRCVYCHLGKPSWSGRTDINGTEMPAHRHRNPEPYDMEHSISSADGGLVAYEGGGIVRGEDTEFFAAAPGDIAVLLQGIDRLRADTEAHRLALSQALGLGTGAPWDAIRDRAAELEQQARRLGLMVGEAKGAQG